MSCKTMPQQVSLLYCPSASFLKRERAITLINQESLNSSRTQYRQIIEFVPSLGSVYSVHSAALVRVGQAFTLE